MGVVETAGEALRRLESGEEMDWYADQQMAADMEDEEARMSEETEKKEPKPPTHTEAPYSFNVTAISPRGFDVQLTIRGEDSGDLIPRALSALAWLDAQKFSPKGFRLNAPTQPAQVPTPAAAGNAAPMCPVHTTRSMKASQFGGWYCTARTGEGEYCGQKVA